MVVSYLTMYKYSLKGPDDSEASEGLLGSGQAQIPDYGGVTSTKSTSEIRLGSRNNTGWLEYFVGFRILFPYIWYVVMFIYNAGIDKR